MAKTTKIKLSIAKPCTEDWDNMTPDEKGKFCGQCNTVVIDFSKYTDKDIVEFFAKTKEHICGNFHKTQLQRLIVSTEPSNRSLFHKVLLGTTLVAGVAGTVQAQSNVPVNTTITPTPADTAKKTTENKTQLLDARPNYLYNIPEEDNVRGMVSEKIIYIVDGVKVSKDTTSSKSDTNFIKTLTKSHLGTPASKEGPQEIPR